jgi:hypothetical protein
MTFFALGWGIGAGSTNERKRLSAANAENLLFAFEEFQNPYILSPITG